MKILALNLSHNASCAVIENGEIIFSIEEERLSKVKRDHEIKKICELLKDNFYDFIYYTSFNINNDNKQFYNNYVLNLLKKNKITFKELIEYPYHHNTHAFSAFYNSGFNEAIVLVVDNGGVSIKIKETEMGSEILSIIKLNYNKEPETLFKICKNEIGKTFNFNNCFFSVDTLSIAGIYEYFIKILNLSEPGSIMGYSSYGKSKFTTKLFTVENNCFKSNQYTLDELVYFKDEIETVCAHIQNECTEIVYYYLNLIKQDYPNIPICVSGGFFQNCVANYNFLKKGIDIFVDPISHDGGTSLGLAQYAYLKHSNDKKIIKYKNLYLGTKTKYEEFKKVTGKNFSLTEEKKSLKDVALLLKNKKSIGIFQGCSEIGPRALGNRSLLFNPSDFFAKEKINIIKKREWYRPYAGTVLDEYKNEWFDLSLKESTEFMSYAVDVKKEKINIIPGICHVDNTCRIQTLKQIDNSLFYNLIKEFFLLTGIPIVGNTSLNLSGKPLVEDFDDLMQFLFDSGVDYVYLPEQEILYSKQRVRLS